MAVVGRPTKLNKTVQNKIVKLIRTGVNVVDACAYVGVGERTFYDWIERGEKGDEEFAQFSQAVNRARNAAKVRAINTIHASLGETKSVRKTVHIVTETRLNKWGQPWEYKRTDEDEIAVFNPGDWRAAVEYLKRRFPDEWSEKRILELGLSDELLKRLEVVAKQADVPASQLFESMLNAIADQLSVSSTNGAGEGARAGE